MNISSLAFAPEEQTALLKLFQEPDVVLEKQANVVELIHQRAHAIDSQTKRKPRILLRIHSDGAQHVRMHHSGTAQLDPARVFTNATASALAFETTEIKLRARLGERKVRRAKARHSVWPKHPSQKLRDRALQVRHRDAAIDTQAFDLEEHRIVCGIWSVTTKHTARRDHPDRHATTLHRVDLHGRCLRAKRKPIGGIERVLPRARRMVLRNVERIEVIEVLFDLAIVFNSVSERNEDIFEALAKQGYRMTMTGARAASGHG